MSSHTRHTSLKLTLILVFVTKLNKVRDTCCDRVANSSRIFSGFIYRSRRNPRFSISIHSRISSSATRRGMVGKRLHRSVLNKCVSWRNQYVHFYICNEGETRRVETIFSSPSPPPCIPLDWNFYILT